MPSTTVTSPEYVDRNNSMTDIVTPAVRSRMMSAIKGRNTKPELLVRKRLFARGLRYSLHSSLLPGKPDLVFRRYKAVVLIHGCFWHGHECRLFKWPKSNQTFWRNKITRNRSVDTRTLKELRALGWRIMTVWECAVRGVPEQRLDIVADRLQHWIQGQRLSGVISGGPQTTRR